MNQQQTKIGKDGAKLAVIAPSLLCNYDCSYCRIKSKTRAPGEHELSKWCDALVGIGAPITHIGGGEPTVLKGFENFALDYPSRLRMTTNLWRHPSLWHEDFWQKFEYLTLSFHPEHTTFEEFRDKARYLTDKFTGQDIAPRMTCTIVAHPKFLDTLERWVTELCAVGVDARGQYFNAPAGSELRTYTDEGLKELKKMDIPMSIGVAGQEKLDAPTLKNCDAGMYYTHIGPRGDARRCSRDQMKLGNIFDGTFSWFEAERECGIACTEACDHSFASYKVLSRIAPPTKDKVIDFSELIVDKVSNKSTKGWMGNDSSAVRVANGRLEIERQGGAMDKQCWRTLATQPGRLYEFRGNVVELSDEFLVRVDGVTILKKKNRGKFKSTFTANAPESVLEVLPTANWNATATLDSLSVTISVPSSSDASELAVDNE